MVCSSQDDMVDLCVVSLVPLVFSYSYTSSRNFSGNLFLFFLLLLCKQMHNRRIGCRFFRMTLVHPIIVF